MTRKVTRDTLDKTKSMIQNLPEKKDALVTGEDAIREMKADIQAALERGYTLADIHKYLNDQGFDLKLTTFKTYWNRNKDSESTTKASSKKGKARSQRPATQDRQTHKERKQNGDSETTQSGGTPVQTARFREDEEDL